MKGTGARLRAAAVAVVGAATLTVSLAPASVAGTQVWHILGVTPVENARLTQDVIQGVDPSIQTVEYRKGGEGNIQICGFQRTEHISVSRQERWTTSGTRIGSTLILQFGHVVDGGSAFKRLQQFYSACTPAMFTKPDRTSVTYSYNKKKKQIRMVWALYTTNTKTNVQRAEGLAIKRAGGALIITRSIIKDTTDTSGLRTDINSILTARQFAKYKAAAYF
jgi:hypothetical protein